MPRQPAVWTVAREINLGSYGYARGYQSNSLIGEGMVKKLAVIVVQACRVLQRNLPQSQNQLVQLVQLQKEGMQ